MSNPEYIDFSQYKTSSESLNEECLSPKSKKHAILNIINSISVNSQLVQAYTDKLPDVLKHKGLMQEYGNEIIANIEKLFLQLVFVK